ncbi:Gfo/Idh/MocA family oxidoreductase [Streptomyces sp. NBC_01387]|uniref:Gfo/Idh/MocA family oxidoreductase n=1 Tax=unclassified Streptomyces TaxID=2593676 RepID=UPI00224D4E6B|nr:MULTISPECIES: Gfo/Idh/MocA family oxidoreductase [unclassified Streptomyces]MCX4553622.1 Gfo/Idh/MocA family oxidoreductase [Streptomyces sp. NBC_01500]WSC18570.1 Gfo/Idh/MocA family oxidoreductase [Streptomyces sp. NBC_01766]WSV52611.1 Gfo/Idh/MocA family oxidoreductase [Streptomyces sp. NBC_01014]
MTTMPEALRFTSATTRTQRLDRPLTIAVAGAGGRGAGYADLLAADPGRVRITAVAEPDPHRRARFAERHGLDADHVHDTWEDLAARPRLADAVIIAVLDHEHLDAALAFIARGYDILLEKPMAVSDDDCVRIADEAERAGVLLGLCHVMRYTRYTRALKAELSAGAIGDLVSVQHLEPIGSYHFAHSFVRGNWRREDETGPLLLTKSCHDIDWLGDLVGAPARRVSSFGSLSHFTAANRPEGAAERCLDCPAHVENTCPFSAARLYRAGLREGAGPKHYFTSTITPRMTEEAVTDALATGPYGRCVYSCDNDVNDHQVVSIEYEGGVTVAFTLSAFTPQENRRTTLFGTRGQIVGDGRFIEIYDHTTERRTVIDTSLDASNNTEGHAGGDRALIDAFVAALADGDPAALMTGARTGVAGHRLVFAAERARRTGTVVTL